MLELEELQMSARREVEIPLRYRDRDLGIGFRADIIVKDCLLLEFKTVDDFDAVHLAQVNHLSEATDSREGFSSTSTRLC